MTSFQAVARVRRLFSIKKVGHCGTLDPFADGVLPICLGRGTAAVQYMEPYDKSYIVTFRLGRSTDTQDLEGKTVALRTPDEVAVEMLLADDGRYLNEAILKMEGVQMQTPPIYSALKLDGRPLYSYARSGESVDLLRKRREITVLSAAFISAQFDPEGDLEAPVLVKARIACSKGTYIRTLVHDLGERLGFGAYCTALTRDETGPFKLTDTVTLEELEALMPDDPTLHPKLRTLDEALGYLPVVELDMSNASRFAHGQFLDPSGLIEMTDEALRLRYRVIGPNGLIGVAYIRWTEDGDAKLAAERVFIRPNE